MRTLVLRQVSNRRVNIFNVVDEGAVCMTEAVIDRRAVLIHLRICDYFRRIADMLAINLPQSLNSVLLFHASR